LRDHPIAGGVTMQHLLKADIGSSLAKALTANVQTVFADDTVPVAAHAAVPKVTKE
jgi:Arc/MetJ family transcription regulator